MSFERAKELEPEIGRLQGKDGYPEAANKSTFENGI